MNRRVHLPNITLCAAASVNVEATVLALGRSLAQVEFGDSILFTDSELKRVPDDVRIVPIGRLASSADYSRFLLRELIKHIRTDHVLIVQWDGFILSAADWDDAFLEFDYIGAPWPQFDDRWKVGNGGFSLRSRRLLEACLDRHFSPLHPEDLAICRTNRAMLETSHGIRFADEWVARRFSYERERKMAPTFGFHGAFNMPAEMGRDAFWQLYRTLDDRRSIFHDAWSVAMALGPRRGAALIADYLGTRISRLRPAA